MGEGFDAHARYGGWALVAGASAGLGAAFAEESARRGFDVALVARRAEVLDETAARIRAEHGVSTRCIVADLAADDAAERIAAATGDLDIGVVVYNAAAELYGPFLELGAEAFRTNVAVNCTTPTLLADHFGNRMRARGRGGIAIVSSLAALQGTRYLSIYAASKAYELILAESLWDELGDHGVDALAYVVGATASSTWEGPAEDAYQDGELSALQARILRPATPREVATRLYDVLPDGPRQFAAIADEEATAANAGRSRAELVAAMGEVTKGLARFAHIPKPPPRRR